MNAEHSTCTCNNKIKAHEHFVDKESKTKKLVTRCIEFIKMLMPAFVFVIIPKCPVCLAGYIALITGAGLSIPAATYTRVILIILCIVSFSYFIIKHVRRWLMNS
jgi:hypothetical protein